MSLKGFNAHCIDVVISSECSSPWRTSFVNGEPHREKRHDFWSLLTRLHDQWNVPWLACGDFNEVLCQDEHGGPRERLESQIGQFKDCLDACGLTDMGFSGPMFTWTNKQEGDDLVHVRLD